MFGSKDKCVNHRSCGNDATRKVNGEPVCDSYNVYQGHQDGGRAYTIVSRH